MVFAPKKVAQDIGWGSRREHTKSDNDTSFKNGTNHGIKEQILAKKSPSLKRKARSDSNDVNSLSIDVEPKIEESNLKPSKEEDLNSHKNSQNSHYKGNNVTRDSLPLRGSLIPGVELETKDIDNVLSTTLTIKSLTDFAFVGRARVKLHKGCIEMFGFTLKSNSSLESNTVMLDCPSWMNSISISSKPSGKKMKIFQAQIEIFSMEPDKFSFELMTLEEARSLITIDDKWSNAARKIIDDFNGDRQSQNKDNEEYSSKNRVLVCGAKNVGKSTFAKYLCNRFLSTQSVERIAFFDCDVGQPELSPPGMLSLTVLTKPLFCPSYVHMVSHDNMEENINQSYQVANKHHSAYYYGSTSPKANPLSFFNGVKQLIEDYETLCKEQSSDIPLIINTDGWVKGMGYEILSSTIDTLKPGHVVQILGSTKAKFFDLTLHAEPKRIIHVLSSPSASGKQEEFNDVATERNPEPNIISSSLLRILRLCTYFLGGYENFLRSGATFRQSGILDDNNGIASALARQCPYMVPFHAVSCTILDDSGNNESFSFGRDDAYPNYLFDVLNASVVGLCTGVKKDPFIGSDEIHSCVGLGIVRSIDREKRLYYILTPVPANILQSKVKSIVVGQIQLPFECVYLGQNAEAFPYQTCEGPLGGTEAVKRNRSFSM